MIRFIAAIDKKKGLATEEGIPWKLPADLRYFREKTEHGMVLMGYGTYVEFDKPLHDRRNYVASITRKELKPGFTLVKDAQSFLESMKEDVWVIGGAGLFAATLKLADELYLTRIEKDFHCTKFFPGFENDFTLVESSKNYEEEGLRFHFEVWKRK